jgi:hypothetical protein
MQVLAEPIRKVAQDLSAAKTSVRKVHLVDVNEHRKETAKLGTPREVSLFEIVGVASQRGGRLLS